MPPNAEGMIIVIHYPNSVFAQNDDTFNSEKKMALYNGFGGGWQF